MDATNLGDVTHTFLYSFLCRWKASDLPSVRQDTEEHMEADVERLATEAVRLYQA